MNFIKEINYVYDPDRDQLWIYWTDLSMMCMYVKPVPREIDVVNFVESVLNGEQNW